MARPNKQQAENNRKLLEWVRKFKETEDPEAFDHIVAVLDGYFQHLAYRKFFYVAGHSPDDLYQEALYALSNKAIPDYIEEKGHFITFAKLCIRRHIITVLKSSNNNRHKALNTSVSMDATVDADEDDEAPMSIGGFLSNGEEGIVDKMVRNESFSKMRKDLEEKLTPLEMNVLDLYLKNMSYQDIVQGMNRRRRGHKRVVQKTIDNALCRIKKKAIELDKAAKKAEKRAKKAKKPSKRGRRKILVLRKRRKLRRGRKKAR